MVHKTGIPIAAIDINESATHAVLAGRDILRTVNVHDHTVTEQNNLRNAVTSHIAAQQLKADEIHKRKEFLPAKDVRWSHGRFSHIIATAASNGRIALFDVNTAASARIELAWIYQHTGQVNKIDFDPHKGYMLLSGSQDKYCKIWDIRDPRKPAGYNQYNVRAPVRDVRWSPTDAYIFALCTENGTVQKWDLRQPSQPQLSFNAHEKSCYVIDWHPDGKHIASGGFDKHLKIWDFQGINRRSKPILQIHTPQAIMNLTWRPAGVEARPRRPDAYSCVQIATSYVEDDPRIHIWDLRRPSMPFRELDRYDTRPSDMLWASRDILWTAGGAGIFRQNDMDYAQIPTDELSSSSMEWLGGGTLLSALADDNAAGRSTITACSHPSSSNEGDWGDGGRRASCAPSSSPVVASTSLPTPDAVDEVSFDMNAMFETRSRRRRTASTTFAGSSASTPPPQVTQKVEPLDKTLTVDKDKTDADQICAVITIRRPSRDGEANPAEHELSAPSTQREREQDPSGILQRLRSDLESNDNYARARSSSVWSSLLAVVIPELQEYADRNRAQRLGLAAAACVPLPAHQVPQDGGPTQPQDLQPHPSPFPKVKTQPEGKSSAISVMSSLFRGAAPADGTNKQDAGRESTSNAPTPLALPMSDYNTTPRRSANILEYDAIEPLYEPLPPSVAQPNIYHSKSSLGSLLYPRVSPFSAYSLPVGPSLNTEHSVARSFSVSPAPSDNSDQLIERLTVASGVSRSSRRTEEELTDASQSFRSQSSIFAMEANTPSLDGSRDSTGGDTGRNGRSGGPILIEGSTGVSSVVADSTVTDVDIEDPTVAIADDAEIQDNLLPDTNPYLQGQAWIKTAAEIGINEVVSTHYIIDDFKPIDITNYNPSGSWADSAYPLICRTLADHNTHVSTSAHILAHLYPFFFAHSSRLSPRTSSNHSQPPQGRDHDKTTTLADKFMAPSTSNRLIETVFAAHLDRLVRHGGWNAQKFDFRRLAVEDFGFTNLGLDESGSGPLVRDGRDIGDGVLIDSVELINPSPAVEAATRALKEGKM